MLCANQDGKSQGEGIFKAPNGDLFLGQWNKNHKRHGKGLSIRASDGTICTEEYEDGKLLKKVKRRAPAASTLHWLPPLSLPGVSDRHKFSGAVPTGHAGHSTTVSKDGGLVVVFGGETRSESGGSVLSNDVWILDVASGVWTKPATSGQVPPPMSGHTATLLGSNRLVIIGGQLSGMEASSSVFVLDISSGVWTCPVVKGLSFVGHTASLIGNREIWVIVQASVFVLTVGTGAAAWEWREVNTDNRSLPRGVPRSFVNHSAVSVGSMIYVFGGKWLGISHGEGKKYERLSAELRILHTEKLMWEAPECTPPPAAPAASAAAGAGAASAAVITDYSGFVRGSWNVPRCEHTATLVGQKLYILGGWTTSNPGINVVDTCYLNDVQVLNVETLAWEAPVAQPLFIAPRSLHSAVAMTHGATNEIWVYGGRNSATTAINEWAILHLPQEGAEAAAKPAAAKKAVAPAAAAASSSSAAAPAAATKPTAAAAAPQPTAAAAPEENDELAAAGSGDILAQFMAQQGQ